MTSRPPLAPPRESARPDSPFVAATAGADVPPGAALDVRAAWPGIVLDPRTFEGYVAARAGRAQPAHLADLYLACACVQGVTAAILAFDRGYAASIARALTRVDSSPAFIDDAVQVVRVKLLVAVGGAEPRLAEYEGRSSLRSWLSIVSVRTGYSLRRGIDARGHEPLPEEVGRAIDGGGLEMGYLKARYKPQFEAALRSAFERLSVRDRMVLRLHLVDGLTVDGLGAFYKVGRSTAARWLAVARETLREGTARELHERLSLTPSEYRSLAALVRSQLDVSLGALFDGASRL